MSVWEFAQLPIANDRQEEFVAAVEQNLAVFREAEGCRDVKLLRAVDKDDLVVVQVEWESIEHHTEIFNKTEACERFSGLIRSYLTGVPLVFHAAVAVDGF